MGCDIVANVDPVASQIKAETFREYVTPNSQAANKVIHDAGLTSSFFICGDFRPQLIPGRPVVASIGSENPGFGN